MHTLASKWCLPFSPIFARCVQNTALSPTCRVQPSFPYTFCVVPSTQQFLQESCMSASEFINTITEMPEFDSRHIGDFFFISISSNTTANQVTPADRVGVLTKNITKFNRLTPNDPYMGRTAPLTSKRCILYIYSTNIGTEYFKHAVDFPFFFLFKMRFVS